MIYLALKVASELPGRYRCVCPAKSGDETILGEQVLLEFEESDYPGIVSVRRGWMGILETDQHKVSVFMGKLP